MNILTRQISLSILFAILIGVSSWISIPIDPVPLTMQTVFIFLAALLLPMEFALLAVVFYILLGVAGLPVFSNGNSGIETLVGPTGGFFGGFILAVFAISLLTKNVRYNLEGKSKAQLYWSVARACLAGTFLIQICGMMWGKIYTGNSWPEIIEGWLNPFYFNMVLKIIIAVFVSVEIWKIVSKRK